MAIDSTEELIEIIKDLYEEHAINREINKSLIHEILWGKTNLEEVLNKVNWIEPYQVHSAESLIRGIYKKAISLVNYFNKHLNNVKIKEVPDELKIEIVNEYLLRKNRIPKGKPENLIKQYFKKAVEFFLENNPEVLKDIIEDQSYFEKRKEKDKLEKIVEETKEYLKKIRELKKFLKKPKFVLIDINKDTIENYKEGFEKFLSFILYLKALASDEIEIRYKLPKEINKYTKKGYIISDYSLSLIIPNLFLGLLKKFEIIAETKFNLFIGTKKDSDKSSHILKKIHTFTPPVTFNYQIERREYSTIIIPIPNKLLQTKENEFLDQIITKKDQSKNIIEELKEVYEKILYYWVYCRIKNNKRDNNKKSKPILPQNLELTIQKLRSEGGYKIYVMSEDLKSKIENIRKELGSQVNMILDPKINDPILNLLKKIFPKSIKKFVIESEIKKNT